MKGTVYKIIALQGNEIYIGSTCGHLNDRWYRHKENYKSYLRTNAVNFYTTAIDLFEKYGVDNCRLVPIKEYEVIDRRHLEIYETLWICKLKSINKIMPVGLGKHHLKIYNNWKARQYREEHKGEIAEKKRQYREKNKEAIAEKKKEKVHCDICNVDITNTHFRRHERSLKHINNLNN